MIQAHTIRVLVVVSLCLVFCILAPLLVFYARGYRYDFKQKEIHQVGMIMIAHDPLAAKSTLNGTPPPFDITAFGYERFTDLDQGTYHVKVERDGYHAWEKDLEVMPEVVTWARYVTLFLQDTNPTELISQSTIESLDLAPNRNWLALGGQHNGHGQITIYSLASQKIVREIPYQNLWPKANGSPTLEKITFGPDSTQILIILKDEKGDQRHCIISRENESQLTVLEDIVPNITEAQWHPDTPSLLYLTSNRNLSRVSTSPQLIRRQIASQVLSFKPTSEGLFIIRPRDEQVRAEPQASLKRLELDGSAPETISEDIELADHYDLNISAKGKIAIKTDSGALYSVAPEKTERIAQNVDYLEWSVDNDQEDSTDELLLYTQGSDILTFDPLISNSETITSLSLPPRNITWYNGNYKYIVFTDAGKIQVIELDERDHRNLIDLWQAADNEQLAERTLFIDNNSKHLFFLSRQDDHDRMQELTIRK